MPRSQWRVAGSFLGVLVVIGCSDSSGVPETGALALQVSTSGDDLDTDGYEVLVDTLTPRAIGNNDSLVVDGLAAGAHVVGLAGVASNCGIASVAPATIIVEPPDSLRVLIRVECVLRTGTLQIRTFTPGNPQIDDDFTVRVDDDQSKAIPPTGAVAFVVRPGEHQVTLELPTQCFVQGPNPQVVSVAADDVVRVDFVVACT